MKLACKILVTLIIITGCAAHSETDSSTNGVHTSGFTADIVNTEAQCFTEVARTALGKEMQTLSGTQLLAPSLEVTALNTAGYSENIKSALITILNNNKNTINSYRVVINDFEKCNRIAVFLTESTNFIPMSME